MKKFRKKAELLTQFTGDNDDGNNSDSPIIGNPSNLPTNSQLTPATCSSSEKKSMDVRRRNMDHARIARRKQKAFIENLVSDTTVLSTRLAGIDPEATGTIQIAESFSRHKCAGAMILEQYWSCIDDPKRWSVFLSNSLSLSSSLERLFPHIEAYTQSRHEPSTAIDDTLSRRQSRRIQEDSKSYPLSSMNIMLSHMDKLNLLCQWLSFHATGNNDHNVQFVCNSRDMTMSYDDDEKILMISTNVKLELLDQSPSSRIAFHAARVMKPHEKAKKRKRRKTDDDDDDNNHDNDDDEYCTLSSMGFDCAVRISFEKDGLGGAKSLAECNSNDNSFEDEEKRSRKRKQSSSSSGTHHPKMCGFSLICNADALLNFHHSS